MSPVLLRQIWKRAGNRCEYCHIPHPQFLLPFQVDHIIARQHGGESTLENLALACFHCNRYKGPNIAGRDPDTRELVRLFHPRTDIWSEHFELSHARIVGRTSIGRTTVQVLSMNADDLLLVRLALIDEGGVDFQ
ncbi:MAG: HNH endonuclease [Acidobacteriaceae bacterium]|nr:HNH endonuclease [Acidobacteriaceae bacterium]